MAIGDFTPFLRLHRKSIPNAGLSFYGIIRKYLLIIRIVVVIVNRVASR